MDLPTATYLIHTTTHTVTLTASIRVDEYGYWFHHHDDTLALHIAHGSLVTIEPDTGPIPTTAQTARDKLRAQSGR